MSDTATPNLPSRDLGATRAFYERLGFAADFADDGWLIMRRGGLVMEFFPYPRLKPASSNFSACLRVDDVRELYDVCVAAGIPEAAKGFPRLHPPEVQESGLRIGALVDPDGSLLRLIEN